MYFYAKYLHYPLPIRQYQYGLHKYDIHLSIFRSCPLTLKTPSKIFTQPHIVNLGECEKYIFQALVVAVCNHHVRFHHLNVQ